jgi:DNA-binding SARP family transcriptional activator/tetratricopeptide (TPR) repeat protein
MEAAAQRCVMLDVTLFGHLRLSCDGKSLRFAVRPKVAPLLAYLLLNARQPVSRDNVAFALWPDESEDAARANLRRHLHYLREALPRSRVAWLITDGRTVRWNPAAAVHVDVADFERFAADPAALQKAVDLYGELLPGYDDEWLIAARERLHQSYLQTLVELARRARGRRDFSAATDHLRRILADDPWREDALRALMAVRRESGDRSSALQLCADFEERLQREMGVGLMPETAALRHAIELDNPLPTIPLEPSPRTSAPVRAELPFEGRDGEMARLNDIWQRTLGGSGALVLVVGEAGIGKTRLAREFALGAEATGARVLWGTTSSPETTPYQAVAEILRAAVGFVEALRLEPYDLAVLSRVVPGLRGAEPLSDPGGEPDAAKLFDVVADVFVALARQRPVIFVLEDLHDAGPATVAMVEHIAERCLTNPILVVITSREGEPGGERLSALRRPLRGEKPFVIALGPLSEDAVSSIAAQSLGPDAASGMVGQRSAGHPLFLAELLHAAADPQGLAVEALPSHLREIIDARIARLSAAATFALRAAAVVGSSFDLEVVAEAIGWSEGRLAAAADELIARRLIRQTANSRSFDYEFAHDLIAAAAYESLPDRERRRCHRRTARAAEHWYASRLTELSAFIARHFERGGEREPAAAHYLRAARAATIAFANAEALALARRALELRPQSQLDRFDLLCISEEVLDRVGDRVQQRARLRDLHRIAFRLRDSERMREVLRRRESFYRYLGEYACARSDLADLARLAFGQARWEAIALRDEAALLWTCSSQPEAHETVARATERAAAAGDAAVLVSTLTLQADIAAALGRREEAAECLQRAKDAAEITGSVMLLVRVLYCELTVLTHFQAWSKVVERAPRLLGLTARVGSRDLAAAVHTMLGGALGSLFDVDRARRHHREAIELYSRCDTNGLFIAYNNLASLELEVGRIDNAQRVLDALETELAREAIVYRRASVSLVASELAALRGETVAAIDLADDAITAARACENPVFEGEALRCKGVALRAVGRVAEAAPALERCVAIFERLKLDAFAARATAELALAWALAGDQRAVSLADESLASCDSGSIADSPLVLWPLSQAFDANGRSGQARALLCRAHDAFRSRLARMRDRRDRTAFSRIPANAALERAYAAAGDPRGKDANAKSPRVRRAAKTRTADRLRPPGRSL